ncbi:MAG TPA: hypothetical protein PKL30_26135 [Leptospiraceae bacterium]|nr:hypothetical protein [Leptospiraceae bacterium]HNH58328.1 hypothetical protein [Leptospiraceae bacterium]HNN82382.1 hypothetical protein [Leptospiraceae bacterium]
MKFKLINLFGIIAICIQPLLSDVFNKMNPDQICVAYKTTKGMFFLSEVEVVGINCNAQFKKSNTSTHVIIPVEKFDSSNSKRDSEVALILGGSKKMPLRFEFLIPKNSKQDTIPATISGKLFIKDSPKDITLNLSQEQGKIRFSVQTKFSTLGIKVESVGPGGLIAEPKDELTLYGQISSKIIFEREN